MNKTYCRLLALSPFALSLLTACAYDAPPLPERETVANRCQSYAEAYDGQALPAERAAVEKWHRYVSCTLGSYMVIGQGEVRDNPEAVVSIRLRPDGSVDSASLLRPTGNAAWDAAVQRAITAAWPLPAAPANGRLARIDMHFRPTLQRTNGSAGISDTSHWSIRHCTRSGGAAACG